MARSQEPERRENESLWQSPPRWTFVLSSDMSQEVVGVLVHTFMFPSGGTVLTLVISFPFHLALPRGQNHSTRYSAALSHKH